MIARENEFIGDLSGLLGSGFNLRQFRRLHPWSRAARFKIAVIRNRVLSLFNGHSVVSDISVANETQQTSHPKFTLFGRKILPSFDVVVINTEPFRLRKLTADGANASLTGGVALPLFQRKTVALQCLFRRNNERHREREDCYR
jgi:hypothetical protein